MTQRSDRIEDLFQRAADLPGADRAAFLQRECPDDDALRAEVLALLAELDAGTRGMLAQSVFAAPAGEASAPVPTRIGRFAITRLLGEGGMGRVFEAVQDTPRRTVAVKVVQPGLASPLALRRFEHEAEILAQLNHPGIAQIYDAGAAPTQGPDGTPGPPQPFLAMELIQGLPLTAYAAAHRLSARQRLALLAEVCDAVAHAHQRAVIHRDLKPANVLVASDGRPKVLDFGIARLSGDRPAGSVITHAGQIVGTIAYMSPEQFEGDPAKVDTRSDVYALGVIGYELIAGRAPFDLRTKPIAEAARIICDSEPPALTGPASDRGDVQTIVAKAMAKDPARRYPSAAELAADLRRYLADEPISARPPSAFYQFSRFARRNRGLVIGASTALLAILLGAVAATLSAFKQAELRVAAEKASAEATARTLEATAAARRATYAATLSDLSSLDVGSARARLGTVAPGERAWEWRYLSFLCESSLGRIPCDLSSAVALSVVDGEPVAIFCTVDGHASLWTPRSEKPPRPIGDWGPASALSVSPDGRVVAQQSGPDVILRRVSDGHELWRVSDADVSSVAAFSPDSSRLLVGRSGPGDIAELSAADGSLLRVIAPEDSVGTTLNLPRFANLPEAAGSNRTSTLISANAGNDTVFIDPRSQSIVQRIPLYEVVTDVSGTFATGSSGGMPVLLDLRGDASTMASTEGVVAVSPSGRWYAQSRQETAVRIADPRTHLSIAVLHGHTEQVVQVFTASSPRWLLSRGRVELRAWDLERLRRPRSVERVMYGGDEAYDAAIAHDGSRVVVLGWGSVRSWMVDGGVEAWNTNIPTRATFARAAFSPDDRYVLGAGWDNSAVCLEAATGRVVWLLKDLPFRAASIACSSSRVIIGGPDGLLLSFDLASGDRQPDVLVSPRREVSALHFSPASGLSVGLADGTLLRYDGDLPAGPSRAIKLSSTPITCITACEATGDLAAGSADGGVCVIPSARHAPGPATPAEPKVRRSSPSPFQVRAIAFSPLGDRLVIASFDGLVRLIDTLRMEETMALPLPGGLAKAVGMTTDQVIASGLTPLTVFDAQPDSRSLDEWVAYADARPLVTALYSRAHTSEGVIRALDANPAISAQVREHARSIALGSGDHLNSLNSRAWSSVWKRTRARDDTAFAIEFAEYCCRHAPLNPNFANTLGVAYYRAGRFADAEQWLAKSDELGVKPWPGGHPINLILRARALIALGRDAEAEPLLDRAGRLASSSPYASDVEVQQIMAEPAPASPASKPPAP